jgi:hypothetical protein
MWHYAKRLILIFGIFGIVLLAAGCAAEQTDKKDTKSTAQKSTHYQNSPFGVHPAEPYEDAEYIGVRWTRGGAAPYLFWSLVDPNMTGDLDSFIWKGSAVMPEGVTKSIDYDKINDLNEAGLNVLYNIDVQPHEGQHRKPGSWMPVNPDAYKAFIIAAVKRYPFVLYWQIGNEPTAKLEDYGEFMHLSYDAVKEGNPAATVLIGGTSGFRMAETFAEYKDEFEDLYLPLLEDIAQEKTRCFDIFDYHWYGDASGDYLLTKDIHQYISQTLKDLGIPAPTSYWITEMGTYSGDPRDMKDKIGNNREMPFQTERQQATDLIKRNIFPLSHGVEKVFMAFGLKEGFKHDEGYFDFTGLIYDGRYAGDLGRDVKKLSYYAYKKMTEVLEGSNISKVETVQTNDGIYIFRLTKQGKGVWIVWNDNADEKQATITGITSQQVKITDAVPKYESGQDVTDYDAAFNSETKTVSAGSLTITVKDAPVFIEEK